MIAIRVRNFRGCEDADIICNSIALVAGRNAAGKSSLAQATGAALTGETLPFGLASKSSAGQLVMAGAANASIELSANSQDGEGEDLPSIARVEWPACQFSTEGSPPKASIWAAGLDHITRLDAKERAQVLGKYLRADPERADLSAALHDAGLGEEEIIAAVWKLIEAQGWDEAYAVRRERGTEFKGRWRQVTNHNWGTRIGVAWRPQKGWTLDLDTATEEDLVAARDAAKAAHEAAIGAAAVSAAQREQLAAEAAELDQRKDALRDFEQSAEDFAAAHEAAQAERAELPPADGDGGMPCPHCGAFVVLRQVDLATRVLEKAQPILGDELRARRAAIADADGKVGRIWGEWQTAQKAVELARARMQMAAEAKNKLEMFGAEAVPAVDTAASRAALEAAEGRLNAWRQMMQAKDIHEKVVSNEKLLAILAPEGLRATKLVRVLDAFNRTQLAPLAAAAEWSAPTIAPDMAIAYGGRPYALLSTSEQYRVRAMLQLAFARLDSSSMVVLDAADVLDGTTRGGLFQMLDDAGLPALVCMTLTRPAHVPDLAAAALGASYWLEEGICRALAHHAPMEAAPA